VAAAEFALFITTNLGIITPLRNSLIAQGLVQCDDLLDYDDNKIEPLCKRMIQPGGIMPGRGGQPPRANILSRN